MQVPLLDLHVLYDRQRDAIDAAMRDVVERQSFILGPDVDAFEREVEAFLGGGVHAVGVSNGSDAIVLTLLAAGIGPGDEVIVPAFTFVSTGTSVSVVGATPVFADVEPASLNLDPASVAAHLTPRTRAVIPVHLFGRGADVPAIDRALAEAGRTDVLVIEDAAQALGARVDDRPVMTLAPLATTSFFPSKNLGCFGDGGLVVARDAEMAERLRMLRTHGSKQKYFNELVGYNARLDALQAAILRVRLPALLGWCDERRANAARYREAFADLGEHLVLPAGDGPDGRFHHIVNQFTVQVRDRDALQRHLAEHGIGSAVYYPRTLSEQPCFAHLGSDPDAVPVSRAACHHVLSIPVYPGLTADQQSWVIDTVRAFFR